MTTLFRLEVAFSELELFLTAESRDFLVPTESFGLIFTCNMDLDLVRVKTPDNKAIVGAKLWIYVP